MDSVHAPSTVLSVSDEDDLRPEEPCVCGAPAVRYDVSLIALCQACADACKYVPDEGEAVH